MKLSMSTMLLAAALAFSGCSSNEPVERGSKPGGPGAPEKKTVYGPADDTFRISLDKTYVRQGERRSVAVNISRNTNFDQDVTLDFSELPKGVSVSDSHPKIKKDETEGHFMLEADDDAAVGEFAIRVTAHPEKGTAAGNDFKIVVDKKK